MRPVWQDAEKLVEVHERIDAVSRQLAIMLKFAAAASGFTQRLPCYAFLVAERARRFPIAASTWQEAATWSALRPERHFHDSVITMRLALARAIAPWLPRCPVCHAVHPWRSSHHASAFEGTVTQ